MSENPKPVQPPKPETKSPPPPKPPKPALETFRKGDPPRLDKGDLPNKLSK